MVGCPGQVQRHGKAGAVVPRRGLVAEPGGECGEVVRVPASRLGHRNLDCSEGVPVAGHPGLAGLGQGPPGGSCVGPDRRPPVIVRGVAGSSQRTVGHRNPGASGSVHRLLGPDSVRYMSVTTAMQRLTAAHHDTQRDNSKAAREPGYAQATGRIRRWWQVLGSNQRRLSRRFYRPLGPKRPYAA